MTGLVDLIGFPGVPDAMLEALRSAYGTMFGQPVRKVPVANIVDWIVSSSSLPRTAVDNYVRSRRNDSLVRWASQGDFLSRMMLMKEVGTALGVPAFVEAHTVEEIMDAARGNVARPQDEAEHSVPGNILVETVCYREGHRNSEGEPAPWVIVSHETGKILSSHKSRKKAEEHLRQMEYYKHKG